MTSHQTHREHTSIKQLTSVSKARQTRLQAEREALAEREQAMEQAWHGQRLDEELLTQQQTQWGGAWQAWAQTGGSLRQVVALRRDKELLMDMAALVARRRAELQVKADLLASDCSHWARRWQTAQEFEKSLEERRVALRTEVNRESERQVDEETLMVLTKSCRSGESMLFSQTY
jgi:hypothetical protein